MKTKERCKNQPLPTPPNQGGEPRTPLLGRGGGRGWWDFATLACFAHWRETGHLPWQLETLENSGKEVL